MAVGADWKQLSTVTGERRVDVPAETAQNRLIGWRLRRGEFFNGGRAENSDAIGLSAPDHHFRELCQVVGGGEEPGVSGDAAHVAGSWIVNHAAQRLAAGRI